MNLVVLTPFTSACILHVTFYLFIFYTCTVKTNIEDGVDFTTRMRKNLVFSAQAHTEGGAVLLLNLKIQF